MIGFDFSGKNYIITGAAGSIGRAIAETVVACGGRVCAIDIDEKTLREMAASLPDALFCYRVMDLSSPDASARALRRSSGNSASSTGWSTAPAC